MPFTLSHVTAVLPFARTPLVPSALVIGSMAPDLFYFLPGDVERRFSHSLAGAVTADLALALVVFVLWEAVFRAPAVDFAPLWLRRRLPVSARRRWSGAAAGASVVASLGVGIATHLLWDSFTHPGWLSEERAGWLQAASTVGGMLLVAVWVALWVRRTPGVAPTTSRLRGATRALGWAVVIAVGLGTGLHYWLTRIGWGVPGLESWLVYFTLRVTVGSAGLAATAVSLAWLLSRPRDDVRLTA
jgi:hypothetical protein